MQTILIIDDDEQTRQVLKAALNAAGYYVFLAESGEAGVRLFRSERVGLVLVDIWMPGKDGLETIMDIRRAVPEAKIVAMTGAVEANGINAMTWASRLGAKGFLVKPFSSAELLGAVVTALRSEGDMEMTFR
jgi:DNA-binding response OmpR family regulator